MQKKNSFLFIFEREKLRTFNSNKNQKNPFLRKILFIEYLTLSVIILLVCKHTDSLTTNTVIPYQGLFLRKEKPRLFEPEKQETPSQSPRGEKDETPSGPLFRGKYEG